MASIIKSSQFNKEQLSFSTVKNQPLPNGSNRKIVYINYKGGKFVVQTPLMFTPFGLNENEQTDSEGNPTGSFNYSVNLRFDDTAEAKQFHDMLDSVTEAVKKQAQTDSIAWFKKKGLSDEAFEMLYNDHIKKYINKDTGEADGKYPDTTKFKIPFYDGEFKCKAYDEKKQPVDIKESITKGSQIKALIQCTGVYFVSGKCGVSWKIIQMKVTGGESSINEYAFIDSDDEDSDSDSEKDDDDDDKDDDDDDDDGTENDDEKKVDTINVDNLINSDSDDIEDSDSDVEEAPPPPKKKSKKGVKK